jgi:signal transduction histidine kinase
MEQALATEEAAHSELDEEAQMAARSVRAALAQAEQAALAGRPWPSMSAGRLSNASHLSAPRGSFVPYLERSQVELLDLRSSSGSTPSGLPEAIVVAIALGDRESKSNAAERLLTGQLPVRPEDIPYLAEVLGAGEDTRVNRLENQLRRAPTGVNLTVLPNFRRLLTERGTIEGWARDEAELLGYEITVDALLSRADVAERASLAGDTSIPINEAGTTIVSVPDIDGLTLAVQPEVPGRLRIWTLRILLWVAVFVSIFGLTTVLRALRSEARALSRERAFLASVTHELRTPLAAIRLFGETLSEGRGDPREYGTLVAQESGRLEGLVERVLAVTRVDERVSFTRLDPARLVRSAVALIAGRAEKRAIRITLDKSLQEGELPEVSWDADGVRRALLNLLDNAVKYGRQGGRIDVRADVDGESVRVAVADDGPGIERRDRKRVFGRFQRGSTEAAGTGLGLYVVEQVARAHGGRVDLETEENRGATFSLILPIEPPETVKKGARKGAPA